MGFARRIVASLIGRRVELPPALASSYPELARVTYRRGGLAPRVGGWMLGRPSVDAITLRRTVFLSHHAPFDPKLLLHELRHVEQFLESRTFPLRYLWESLRHGYHANRFERDARDYAAQRVARTTAAGITSARDV